MNLIWCNQSTLAPPKPLRWYAFDLILNLQACSRSLGWIWCTQSTLALPPSQMVILHLHVQACSRSLGWICCTQFTLVPQARCSSMLLTTLCNYKYICSRSLGWIWCIQFTLVHQTLWGGKLLTTFCNCKHVLGHFELIWCTQSTLDPKPSSVVSFWLHFASTSMF